MNPGSVGQPKDGDPSAAYAVWEEGEIKLRRIAYPIEDTIRAYARTTLSSSDIERLTKVLRTGGDLRSIPSEDALRPARCKGIKVALGGVPVGRSGLVN